MMDFEIDHERTIAATTTKRPSVFDRLSSKTTSDDSHPGAPVARQPSINQRLWAGRRSLSPEPEKRRKSPQPSKINETTAEINKINKTKPERRKSPERTAEPSPERKRKEEPREKNPKSPRRGSRSKSPRGPSPERRSEPRKVQAKNPVLKALSDAAKSTASSSNKKDNPPTNTATTQSTTSSSQLRKLQHGMFASTTRTRQPGDLTLRKEHAYALQSSSLKTATTSGGNTPDSKKGSDSPRIFVALPLDD